MSPTKIENVKQLTDLNVDCLEHIFRMLNFEDLINVANTNNKLIITAAAMVYNLKYGNMTTEISIEAISVRCLTGVLNYDKIVCEMEFDEHSTAIAFLNNFGDSIKSLQIYMNVPYYKQMEQALYENCAKTIIELNLVDYAFSSRVMESIKKPFAKIEKICIKGGSLTHHFTQFTHWFPNMRHLKLIQNLIFTPEAIEIHYPHLEHLSIHVDSWCGLKRHNITTILHRNLQLRSFDVYLTNLVGDDWYLSPDFIRAISNLVNLEHFEWGVVAKKPIKYSHISMKYIRKLSLNILHEDQGINITPFEVVSLEELTMRTICLNEQWIDFIVKNKNLMKLNLMPFDGLATDTTLLQLVKALPYLQDVTIFSSLISGKGIAKVISTSASLRKLVVIRVGAVYSRNDIISFYTEYVKTAYIPNGWNYYTYDQFEIFERTAPITQRRSRRSTKSIQS